MKKIFSTWISYPGARPGHSTAQVTYYAELFNPETGDWPYSGKHYKTIRSAIKDGQRLQKQHPGLTIDINAHAEIQNVWDDGEIKNCDSEAVHIGYVLDDGSFLNMGHDVDWL